MSENSTVTTEIDVEAAISEIAEMEVSKALESAAERTETTVPENETLTPDSLNDTENIETEITAVTEISEFAEEQVMTVSEETFTVQTEDNISALPPETTAAITETEKVTSAAVVTEESVSSTKSEITANQILMPVIIAVLALTAFIMKKSGGKKKNSDRKYAKDRDAERLNADKPAKPKKKGKRDKSVKEKRNLSKKTLDTIPYKRILPYNIWYLGKKMYSKAYTFDDINFNLADEEQQYVYLDKYIEFMNILDDTVDCQICLWNSMVNVDEYRHRILMKQTADEFFNLRFEYNSRVLEENIKKGQNAIQKHMYVTLTIKAADEETARRKFKSLDIAAVNSFNRIGNTNLRELTSQERLEMLKDFYIGANERTVPELTEENCKRSEDKLYCSPDYFDFKKDYFMFNDTYAKVVYIRDYPATATSEIFTDLLKTGIEIMITTNIETYDSAAARKLVQRQITAIDTDMAKREVAAAQHGNFSTQMPQRIKNQRDSMVAVYDKITMQDQKLFLTNIQILIKAILDYIWNRLSRNRDLGRATYIYFDEAHLLFADEYCLDYLKMLWKRARKYGGVLTGITQNVEDLLKDEKSRSMLSNSEFLALLKQNSTDAAKLQDILHFTDSEIRYVKDTPAGHGILVLGGKDKIPFFDEFPKDTELYEKMSTNFSETAKMLAESE